jgi:predicted transposase YdaD
LDSKQRFTKPEESDLVESESQQQNKNKTQIETINKLRKFGLSNEQIAEALEISLDLVDRVELKE